MYDIVTSPRGPHPIETFKGAPPPALGNWVEHTSRRKREAELFQDLQRHPWVGVRQATRSVNLYNQLSHAVDADLRRVPYGTRLHNPPSGNFPLIVGKDAGTGPGPWWDETPGDRVEEREKLRSHWREHYVWDPLKRQWSLPKNTANRTDGPGKTI